MKVYSISFSHTIGGAGIAAENFALLSQEQLQLETVRVNQDRSGLKQLAKRVVSLLVSKLQAREVQVKHSLNLFSDSNVVSYFNYNELDSVYHLHWINNDTISLRDLRKIPFGSIVSLHDEWAFLGMEHCSDPREEKFRFIDGYPRKLLSTSGLNLSYFAWQQKIKAFRSRKDLLITGPSSWIVERAKSSTVFQGSQVSLLPNPIDIEIFKPSLEIEIIKAKKELGIPKGNTVILFGAVGGLSNPLKGGKILLKALRQIALADNNNLTGRVSIVSFGASNVLEDLNSDFHTVDLGYVKSKKKLSIVYSLSDLTIVPSLVESFGQVAAESLSCETPVVCFRTSGLNDFVKEGFTGFVSPEMTSAGLGGALLRGLKESAADLLKMGKNGRAFVKQEYAPEVVALKYEKLLNRALALKEKKLIVRD